MNKTLIATLIVTLVVTLFLFNTSIVDASRAISRLEASIDEQIEINDAIFSILKTHKAVLIEVVDHIDNSYL